MGGFVKKEQLLEVYGIDSVLYNSLSEHVELSDEVSQININKVGLSTLKKHPYINYNLARAIINYRKQHGVFGSTNDLMKINLMDSIRLQKLVPYVMVK